MHAKKSLGVRVALMVLLTVFSIGLIVAWIVWMSVFVSTRTDVSGVSDKNGTSVPQVSYSCLYEDGSYEAKCYEALSADFGEGLCPSSWNVTSWGLLPARESDRERGKSDGEETPPTDPTETSSLLSSIARFVMLDSPQYSAYLKGNVSFEVVGNRYRPEAASFVKQGEITDEYSEIQALVAANYTTLHTMSEGSEAKYACVAYRFLCETAECDSTSSDSNIKAVLDPQSGNRRTSNLGVALIMKMLLDADGIPNYVAYGTLMDTGQPYTWNVAWLDDSWRIFDVPDGCKMMAESYPHGDARRWAMDSNIASIPTFLSGCMATPESYESKLSLNKTCAELQLRYEVLVSEGKIGQESPDGKHKQEENAPKGEAAEHEDPLSVLQYRNLLDDVDQRFYDAVSEDLVSGRYIDSENPESWFISPVEIQDDAECSSLTEVASCAMYDNPVLSVTNGGGGWSLKYWSKKSNFGYISRYFISSPISTSDGTISMKMETTKNSAHVVFEDANEESGGDTRKFVYAAYRDISANCLYSDDIDDSVHHNDAYGALVESESKCYGLSCAMKMVLDEKGIPNFVAFGTLNDEGHAWNMVHIDGEWFACDLTAGAIMTKDTYADGTINRDLLFSEINEIDTFYTKCLVPADDFYAPGQGITPSVLSMQLQESYGGD